MTIEEFKEELNNYMGAGTFTVKEVDNNNIIHIIWNINGNDYSSAIESKLLDKDPTVISEYVVRPNVAKFKAFHNRRNGINASTCSEQRIKEIAEEVETELAKIKSNME